jgi:hypothetical protein
LKFAPQLLMARGDEQRERIGGARRGTVLHLRNAVRAILAGLTGLNEKQMRGIPWVIEVFRERQHFQLGIARRSRLQNEDDPPNDSIPSATAAALWSPDSTGRLQLGDNSVLGQRKLLPTRRQELDPYEMYAHRIRVVVPACWMSNLDDRCAVEEMIEAETPAHVDCVITLVKPGLRIGLQSTVGVDTILADWPPAVLAGTVAKTLGLGQGIVLPGSIDHRPPPFALDGTLETHTL